MQKLQAYLKSDILSGLVVFLISVPLCLGIALASGAPLFSGMISGIIGGIVVGSISKSPLSVSGPAAGLTAIVLSGISTIGSFEGFLLAGILAGIFQVILGIVKAGTIGYYFPSNVINGMLTAIGIIIILKQLPHLFGYDAESLSDGTLSPNESHITATIEQVLNGIQPGIVITSIVSLLVMVLWDKYKPEKLKLVPGAGLAVLTGVLVNFIFIYTASKGLIIESTHLVNLPIPEDFASFLGQFATPDFSYIVNKDIWILALTIGVVASLETLLTIEATDKIDPEKRFTDSNRELLAQGTGNIISGLIGGIPITSVIVRSSANMNAGAKSKLSTIVHGILLLVGAMLIPAILNYIPLASLAVILVVTGYKLCKPSVFMSFFKMNKYRWFPFIATVVAIVFTDLLVGVAIGMAIAVGAILIGNLKNTYHLHQGQLEGVNMIRIELSQEVSFLNKAALTMTLDRLPNDCTVVIDATKTFYIDFDVLEMIREFEQIKAPTKNIKAVLTGFKEEYDVVNNDHIFYEEIPGLKKNAHKRTGMKATEVITNIKKGNKVNGKINFVN
ncbi:MAG: SulP family inorganic anion transporter [Saprospiraceae bacterium]|jgi:MFS superfamily sulfate permease-like transporter|nr:SulP family inorganic anion transporter [Candidatus Brachybacter algidus]MBP7306933.1 SulP family inorganic anion transporter [Saprospiraceae bacterium]MBK8356238.1 SulP family inorganic anion transporter [Candidatus Brachybacter algidus]MBK8748346.1 SulP family inorganic anion transporter [Candidatus Brachybacter algidus]MBK9022544.1 SulP family inorganic anion transporter [Candidatus Brachybacter algidus]MBL0117450.1 SulP family inorganic anion transporter [Candidatus Brachybacter algidus